MSSAFSRRSGARRNAAAGREPSAAPPPQRLQVSLGSSVVLHPGLAACVLHELVKFLSFTRGQTNTPFEQLRGRLEAVLGELADEATGAQQVPLVPSGGAAAGTDQATAAAAHAADRAAYSGGGPSEGQQQQQRPRPALRRRRVRVPTPIKRLAKFVGSMDALMSSLSPQLLASALPSHVALTFGPSPARPREVYCITFNPPLAAAAATAAAAGNIGSVPAPPAQLNTPLPPYPSHAGFITIRNNHQHEQLQQAWTGVGGGLGEEGPAAEGTAQEPAAEGSAPAAAAAALQLGPDPCAAAAAVLTERERSALRRAMRGLVVSQEQVPAWEKLLRPTSMFLAVVPGRPGWVPQTAAMVAGGGGGGGGIGGVPVLGAGGSAAGGGGGGLRARRGRPGVAVFKAAQRLVLGLGPPGAGGGRAAGRAVRRALQVHLEVLSSGAIHAPPADAHPPTPPPAGTAAAAAPARTPTAPPGTTFASASALSPTSTASPAALASLQLATSQLRLSTTPAPRDYHMQENRSCPAGAGDAGDSAGDSAGGRGVAGTGGAHNSSSGGNGGRGHSSCCWYVCSASVRSVVKPEEQEQG